MSSYAQYYTNPLPIPAPSSQQQHGGAHHSRSKPHGHRHRHSSRSRSRSGSRRSRDEKDDNGGSPDSTYYSASPSPPLPPLPEGMLLVLPPQSSSHVDAETSSSGSDSEGAYYYEPTSSPPDEDDWDAGSGPDTVDIHDYIHDRFVNVYDPIPSGLLNNKHRELLDLQAKAQARLARSRARFQEGVQDAREVRQNLEWTSQKMSYLKTKASRKYGNEYKRARERYPSPERY